MEDNEIIETLDCLCGVALKCEECPYQPYDFPLCERQVSKDALNLINRQKAEIDELEKECDRQYEQAEADIRANIANGGTSCHWCMDRNKAEAVKEFAERLKEVWFGIGYESPDVDFEDFVDTLLKEMVGENNGKM